MNMIKFSKLSKALLVSASLLGVLANGSLQAGLGLPGEEDPIVLDRKSTPARPPNSLTAGLPVAGDDDGSLVAAGLPVAPSAPGAPDEQASLPTPGQSASNQVPLASDESGDEPLTVPTIVARAFDSFVDAAGVCVSFLVDVTADAGEAAVCSATRNIEDGASSLASWGADNLKKATFHVSTAAKKIIQEAVAYPFEDGSAAPVLAVIDQVFDSAQQTTTACFDGSVTLLGTVARPTVSAIKAGTGSAFHWGVGNLKTLTWHVSNAAKNHIKTMARSAYDAVVPPAYEAVVPPVYEAVAHVTSDAYLKIKEASNSALNHFARLTGR